MFCVILACIFISLTNGFLFDTSTHSTLGGSGITDKHYYDLLDLIMEERRSRRQLEQYVATLHTTISQLSTYASEIKNETTDLKANYSKLLTEHFQLKNKMASFENRSPMLLNNTSNCGQQENNETKRLERLIQTTQNEVSLLITDKEARNQDFLALYNLTLSTQQDLIRSQLEAKSEIQNSRKYTDNIFHNLSLSLSAIDEARRQDILALYNLTLSNQHDLTESQMEVKSEIKNNRNYAENTFHDLIQSQSATDEARKQDFIALYNITLSNQQDLIKIQLEAKSEIQNSRKYAENIFQNLSLSQAAINTSLNYLKQQRETETENVGFTACGAEEVIYNIIKFTNVKTSYGIRDLSTLRSKGQFICEKTGLYLVIASIMSQDSNAFFQIMKNGASAFGYFQITPWHHATNMGHTATGSAVTHLDINDTISIFIDLHVYGGDYSCLSIVKIK